MLGGAALPASPARQRQCTLRRRTRHAHTAHVAHGAQNSSRRRGTAEEARGRGTARGIVTLSGGATAEEARGPGTARGIVTLI